MMVLVALLTVSLTSFCAVGFAEDNIPQQSSYHHPYQPEHPAPAQPQSFSPNQSQNHPNPHQALHNQSYHVAPTVYNPYINFTGVESRDAYQIQSPSHGWPNYHPPHHQEHHNHHHSHTPAGWGWDDKHQHQHDFRSYFDIALTALAFLSFGIFLLNLLLNALLFAGLLTTTGGTGGTVTYTTTGTGTGTGTGTATGTNGGGMTVTYTTTGGTTIPGGTTVTTTGTGTGIGIGRASARAGTGDIYYNTTAVKDDEARIRRRKRATLELYLDPMSSMDLIALNVLKSIDAMTEKHECAGKVFCESNRQAQIIRKGFQFLMPLCSVSASFIRKKLGWQEDIWDHLTAVLLGVGEANCQAHFPHC